MFSRSCIKISKKKRGQLIIIIGFYLTQYIQSIIISTWNQCKHY